MLAVDMKCNLCGSEWKTDKSISASMTACPFCQGKLAIKKDTWQLFDNTRDLLAFIAAEYGNDALFGRKYFSDHTAPLMPQGQKNFVKQAFDCGAVKILQDNIKQGQEHKEIAIKQAVRKLIDLHHTAEEAAECVIREFVSAIGWNTTRTDLIAPESDDPESLFNLGSAHRAKKNHEQAVGLFMRSANKGFAPAMRALGGCYRNGEGVETNHNQAVNWFKEAAKFGDAVAMCILGIYYVHGTDVVRQDYSQAFYWFTKGTERGNIDSMYGLAICYANGEGVEQDLNKAIILLTKAAELGSCRAMNSLGLRYRDGDGVEYDPERAIYWFRKSAEQEDIWAQNYLGDCFAFGYALTKKDPNQAVYWYKKAAAQGDEKAKNRLDYYRMNGKFGGVAIV